MTKAEIIASIINVVRGGITSNTEPITNEQLSWQIDIVRAKLIRQDLNKKRSINYDLVQTLCIDLVIADASDCPCEYSGCTILKSSQEIPTAIELSDKNLIISVGPIDLTVPRFNLINYYRSTWFNYNRFGNKVISAFIHNKYLYCISRKTKNLLLTKANMQIILEKPEDAVIFKCSGIPCFTNDSKYPVSSAMVYDIQTIVLDSLIKIEAVAPSDQSGNAKFDIKPNTD